MPKVRICFSSANSERQKMCCMRPSVGRFQKSGCGCRRRTQAPRRGRLAAAEIKERAQRFAVKAALDLEEPLRDPGGDRKSQYVQSKLSDNLDSQRGTSESYLRRRLATATKYLNLEKEVDNGGKNET